MSIGKYAELSNWYLPDDQPKGAGVRVRIRSRVRARG